MKKKHSVGRFTLIVILCAIFAVLTIFSFSLPGSSKDYDFVGFARAINLGVEYRGGTVETYSVNLNTQTNLNLQDGISSNVTRIEYLLDDEGYNTNVYQNGNNIVVEFFDEYSPVGIEDIINAKTYFAIKTTESDTAEEVVKAEDILDAYATTSGSQNVLVINFTTSGATNFAKVIENGTGYFYVGTNSPFSLSLTNANSSYVGIVMKSLDTAKSYASQILAAKYDMSFEKLSTTEYSKADANKNVIVLICLVLALFVLAVALLVCLYKHLGLVGGLILTIGLLLQILLLQAVPETAFTFTGPALFASLLSFALGVLSLLIMFKNMHNEYKQGKILYASVKIGYTKIWTRILDMFVVFMIPAIIAYFFGSYLVKQFAMALICGLAVYGFTTLILTKFFTKWLTYIKFKNADYGFKRGTNVNELK